MRGVVSLCKYIVLRQCICSFAGRKSGEGAPDSEPRLSSCREAEAFVRLGEAPIPDRKRPCCEILTESRFLMQNAKWELKHT